MNGWISAHSHTYERGVNYEDETIIIDEVQNFTLHQLRKIITRCADSCKVILIGNLRQCDLVDSSLSGLKPYIDHSYGERWIRRLRLTHNFRGRVAQWADEI
jgi:predicted ribonuclease YlaK